MTDALRSVGLKIGLVFDRFFFDFGSILGSKMEPKSTNILGKSASKLPFDFEAFSTPFFRFPLRFSTPGDTQIEPKRKTVVRFHTFLVFSLRSLLGSIFDRIGFHFGWFWYPFSLHLPIQRPIKKTLFSNRFFFDFCLILASILESQLYTIALFWFISRCLGSVSSPPFPAH